MCDDNHCHFLLCQVVNRLLNLGLRFGVECTNENGFSNFFNTSKLNRRFLTWLPRQESEFVVCAKGPVQSLIVVFGHLGKGIHISKDKNQVKLKVRFNNWWNHLDWPRQLVRF